jgi:hypothetical protein
VPQAILVSDWSISKKLLLCNCSAKWIETWWEAPIESSVLRFLKAEWKVSDTGSAHWASSFILFYFKEYLPTPHPIQSLWKSCQSDLLTQRIQYAHIISILSTIDYIIESENIVFTLQMQGFIMGFWEWYFWYHFGKFLINKLAIRESK